MDINKLLAQVKEKGADQTQAKKGPELPPVGTARARLVEYIELGKHRWKKKVNGKEEEKEGLLVHIAFELSGGNYKPRETDDGPRPILISPQPLLLSLSERAQFFKIFTRMRAGADVKHMVELSGDNAAFLLDIVHNKSGDNTYANIDFEKIRPAAIEQMDEEGNMVRAPIKVDAALTPVKLFVWDFADPEAWDALYIAGEWEERKDDKGNVTAPARSKNKWQEKIRSAINFDSLPCKDYAAGVVGKAQTEALDAAVGDVEPSTKQADPDDLMGGIA